MFGWWFEKASALFCQIVGCNNNEMLLKVSMHFMCVFIQIGVTTRLEMKSDENLSRLSSGSAFRAGVILQLLELSKTKIAIELHYCST